jgi:polyhydroxyalkanoate synthesis regulator protein
MEEIVKYKNRKLYSRTSKRYVNLTDIKEMVQEKKTVVVTDFNGSDITSVTLAKVVALTDASVNELETIITNN